MTFKGHHESISKQLFSLSFVGGRKIYFSGEMAGYYVLSPFKLTIVRNSITLDNATQYNDSNRKDSENNSITIPIKEDFRMEISMDGGYLWNNLMFGLLKICSKMT